jgi:nucleobase:cation symporter-1, NCS1 family
MPGISTVQAIASEQTEAYRREGGRIAAASRAPAVTPGVSAIVEQKGIEHLTPEERGGKPSGLFWMWAGAVWNVEFVVYGTVIVAFFGLSFAQAVPVILFGNLFYLLTGLASLQGPAAGTTAFGVSRAAFGPHGNRVPSVFNWLTQVGFEIEGIALVVLAGLALAAKGGVGSSNWLKALLSIPHGAGWGSLFVALALVISAGGLGWTENGNDYSRYLPADSNMRNIVLAVALGGAIPSALLEILGAAVVFAVPPSASFGVASVTGLVAAFPGWFVVPYLIVAIFQLFAINTIDLYSSGVTLQSIGLHLKRYHCVLIDTVVCCGFTFYAIYSSRFTQLLSDFLLFIIVWLGPWCAIYLVDYWLRGGRYDPQALQNERGGRYFRQGGVHWPALIAQAVGMVAAALWLNAYSPYVSPLSSRVDGSDFSVFMGLIFGGLTYYLLARRSVQREQDDLPAATA